MTQPMVECSPLFSALYDGDADVTLYWFDEQKQVSGFDPDCVTSFVQANPWQPWPDDWDLQLPLQNLVLTLAARVAGDGSLDEFLTRERAYVDYVASGGWKVPDEVESTPQ